MSTYLLCETCGDVADMGDTATLPADSPHAGHRGVAVAGCADETAARRLLAGHLRASAWSFPEGSTA